MSGSLQDVINLHELLERFLDAQKKDILLFTKGHLNETKLFQLPENREYRTWLGSAQQPPDDGLPSDDTVRKSVRRGKVALKPLKVSQASCTTVRPKSVTPDISKWKKKSETQLHWYDLFPTLTNVVTKTEQFEEMQQFELKVLQKQDGLQTNSLSRNNVADYLNKQLEQKLINLHFHGNNSAFQRLQVHSQVFDNLILSSSILNHILMRIKAEYDNYLSYLLDGQQGKHRELEEQIALLSEWHKTKAPELKADMCQKLGLEMEVHKKLQENERLRSEIRKEMEFLHQPNPTEITKEMKIQVWRTDPSAHVQELNDAIIDKLEAIHNLRADLRSNFVPTTVCAHLQQCIKESNVEMQKLKSEKEYYEHLIVDLEKDLQETIESADTTDKDAKKIWKKLDDLRLADAARSAARRKERVRKGPGASKQPLLDSEEDDESSKWNWYIS